jgi:hypothetical protein
MCARSSGSSGRTERVPQSHHGRLSRFSEAVRELLRGWLREQPDLTEAELRERLAGRGVYASRSRVGQVLRAMGLRRKKSRSMQLSAIPMPTSSGTRSISPPPRSSRKTDFSGGTRCYHNRRTLKSFAPRNGALRQSQHFIFTS